MADTNKKNNFLDYEGLSLFWNNVKKVIEDNELVTATALTNLDTRVVKLEDKGSNPGTASNQIIAISYTDLKTLRDNAQLVPGQQYRITDYTCTTTQENTRAVGHQFDIIVTADDESTLNEVARAAVHYNQIPLVIYSNTWGEFFNYIGDIEKDNKSYHCYESESHDCQFLIDYIHFDNFEYNSDAEYPFSFSPNYRRDNSSSEYTNWEIGSDIGETVELKEDPHEINYFASSNLSAWKLKYCLDNDTTRFAWADSANGKGVIYRMIDEFDNDIPYDFKNIQFKHPNDTTTYPHYYYTFASGNVEDNTDCSLNIACACYSNTIKNAILHGENINETPMVLNQIIFIGAVCVSNTFGYDCKSNSFGEFCGYNTFGNACSGNTFGDGCVNNTFGNACSGNTFGGGCMFNTFGNDYINNTFGSNYGRNTFGSSYGNNTFGDNYQYNIFGNGYGNNTFGSSYSGNTFGNGISRNIVGNNCLYNTFGNDCIDNTIGDNCQSNTFGNECAEITFGNDCSYNTFGNMCYQIKFASGSSTSATKYNYYQYNHFGDGCREILFKGAETASVSAQVQNYNFSQGLRSTSVGFLTIDGVRNRVYETKVAKNSTGELKIYCEADLIS